jgi:hypothetical protein
VALIDCATPGEPLTVRPVKNTPWQLMLKDAGLSQKGLAAMLRVTENTISRQMKGDLAVPGYVSAFIAAWRIMSDRDREEWRRRRAAGETEPPPEKP